MDEDNDLWALRAEIQCALRLKVDSSLICFHTHAEETKDILNMVLNKIDKYLELEGRVAERSKAAVLKTVE